MSDTHSESRVLHHLLIIDTDHPMSDSHLGVRMIAFLTGKHGLFERFDEIAEHREFCAGNPGSFDLGRIVIPEERWVFSPGQICSTHGRFSDGFGNNYRDGQEQQAWTTQKAGLERAYARECALCHDEETAKRLRTSYEAKIAGGLKKYDTYCSVRARLTRALTVDELMQLQDRAAVFAVRHDFSVTRILVSRVSEVTELVNSVEIPPCT